MSYRLKAKERVDDGIRRIALEQIDSALQEVDDAELDSHETIHQVRKRCKKLRALIRLSRTRFEQTYQRENSRYRDAAARLSATRDAQAVIETFDKLLEYAKEGELPDFSDIRQRLCNRRDAVESENAKPQEKLSAFRREMMAAKGCVPCWCLRDEGFDTIAGGLKKTYKRGRKAMKRAAKKPRSKTYHEWRKRVKYHRYHVRLLQDMRKKPMKGYREELHKLSDLLGFEHDLAVLENALRTDPERFTDCLALHQFFDLVARSREEMRNNAHHLGARLFNEKPKHLKKRLRKYWKSWKKRSP